MKLFAAILFFVVLLCNTIGYRALNNYLQIQSDIELETLLDEQQYSDEELISFKVPLSIPYNSSLKDFERVDGEISIKGVIYKYVKRRISGDTLELLCIVNDTKMHLESAREQFLNLCYELQHSKTAKKSSSLNEKTVPLEYCLAINSFHMSPHIASSLDHQAMVMLLNSSPQLSGHDQPPENFKS